MRGWRFTRAGTCIPSWGSQLATCPSGYPKTTLSESYLQERPPHHRRVRRRCDIEFGFTHHETSDSNGGFCTGCNFLLVRLRLCCSRLLSCFTLAFLHGGVILGGTFHPKPEFRGRIRCGTGKRKLSSVIDFDRQPMFGVKRPTKITS